MESKPVFYFYEGKGLFGDVENAILSIRDIIKQEYNINLFLISDHTHLSANPNDTFRDVEWGKVAELFDALMPMGGLYDGFLGYRNYFKGTPVENSIDNQKWLEFIDIGNKKWSSFSKQKELTYMPSAPAGISYRYTEWGNPEWPRLERDPVLLKDRMKLALAYIDAKYRILFLPEYNNFFEESVLQPDTKYGFKLLEAVRDSL